MKDDKAPRNIKAPKSAVLEVLASEPLRTHSRDEIARSFAVIKDGELDKPSSTTIYKRIRELIASGVDILSLLKGYLLVPKDEHLWTPELYIALTEAKEQYEAFNKGNVEAISVLNRATALISEDIKKQIAQVS